MRRGRYATGLKDCGRAFRASYQEPVLAAYGSVGEIDGTNTLLLGILYGDGSSGPLSRYALRAWSGSCDNGFRHYEGTLND